jgi:hypothetical protein
MQTKNDLMLAHSSLLLNSTHQSNKRRLFRRLAWIYSGLYVTGV